MMISWCIVVSVLLGLAHSYSTGEAFMDPKTKVNPTSPDPRCDRLVDFVSSVLKKIESSNPSLYAQLQVIAAVFYEANIQNRTELETSICPIIGVKTLREVYDKFNFAELEISYEEELQYYRNTQQEISGIGGYTNLPRLVEFLKDLRAWVVSVPEGGTVPSEATDLTTLTRFFEVMQVKYGSRWLTYATGLRNGAILIKDARETAKELYGTKSGEDVMKVLDIDAQNANQIYKVLLLGSDTAMDSVAPSAEEMELLAEGITLAGELGLLTLTY